MVYWIAKTCSSSCVDSLFIRRLLLPLQDATQPHQLVKNGSDEEIYANLRLIASAVRGYADSSYLRNVFQVALAAMKETNRKLYKAGSRLLRSLLEGLCSTTLANHWDSTRTNQHWTIPTHWDMAVEFIEQTLEFLDSNTFIGEEELLNDEMCKERIFSAARTLHALQRGGRWLLAGAQVDEENCSTLSPFKRPLYAGMFGEMNGMYHVAALFG